MLSVAKLWPPFKHNAKQKNTPTTLEELSVFPEVVAEGPQDLGSSPGILSLGNCTAEGPKSSMSL